MRTAIVIAALLAFAGLGVGFDRPAYAEDKAWPVHERLLGKDKGKKKREKAEDVSGIACMNEDLPRKCLVIDDEVQFAQVVIVEKDSLIAGAILPLVDGDLNEGNLDGEGVAFSKGGPGRPDYFYIVGSHGHPRDRKHKLDDIEDRKEITDRTMRSSRLIRLEVGPDTISDEGKLTTTPPRREVDLHDIFKLPRLAPLQKFVDKRLDEKINGLNVEGIAAVDRRLYVGLRAPVLGDGAQVISFDEDALFNGTPPTVDLHALQLGPGRGIRDLAAHGSGILVLAGPAYEPNTESSAGKTGEYSIFFWDRTKSLVLLKDLRQYMEDKDPLKPEALLPLEQKKDGSLEVLVLFGGATEGGPRPVRVPD